MNNKAIGLAMLVVGVILLIYGINASESVTSEVKEAITGTPTDKTIWLLVGGAALGLIGLVIALRPGNRAPA